jgi:hypothetical protein
VDTAVGIAMVIARTASAEFLKKVFMIWFPSV